MPTPSVETFLDFTNKTTPLTGDFLVGYDGTAEIRTTIKSIINTILPQVNIVPTGTIITFSSNTAPSGWLPCDGRLLSTTDSRYQALYNVIKDTYGSTAGYFNLPDLRGYFVRGWDNSRYIDIIDGTYSQTNNIVSVTTSTSHNLQTGNTASIQIISGNGVNGTPSITKTSETTFTYTATNNLTQTSTGALRLPSTSRKFGTTQGDVISNHTHTLTDPGHTHTINDPGHTHTAVDSGHTHGFLGGFTSIYDRGGLVAQKNGSYPQYKTTDAAAANITVYGALTKVYNSNAYTGVTNASTGNAAETRPKNIALLYCIKT